MAQPTVFAPRRFQPATLWIAALSGAKIAALSGETRALVGIGARLRRRAERRIGACVRLPCEDHRYEFWSSSAL